MDRLDLADRALRSAARKLGHTQPRSCGRAARAKRRGIVVAAPPDRLPSKRCSRKTLAELVFWAVKRFRPLAAAAQMAADKVEEKKAKLAKHA